MDFIIYCYIVVFGSLVFSYLLWDLKPLLEVLPSSDRWEIAEEDPDTVLPLNCACLGALRTEPD